MGYITSRIACKGDAVFYFFIWDSAVIYYYNLDFNITLGFVAADFKSCILPNMGSEMSP